MRDLPESQAVQTIRCSDYVIQQDYPGVADDDPEDDDCDVVDPGDYDDGYDDDDEDYDDEDCEDDEDEEARLNTTTLAEVLVAWRYEL